MDDAKVLFYTNKQVHDDSDAEYLTKFKDICQVIEHYGRNLGDDQALIDEELVNYPTTRRSVSLSCGFLRQV